MIFVFIFLTFLSLTFFQIQFHLLLSTAAKVPGEKVCKQGKGGKEVNLADAADEHL